MRIASYNVEWFSSLFDKQNRLLRDQEWSRRYKVRRRDQADAIAAVIKRVDPDIMLIVEAPNTGGSQDTITALGTFAKHYNLRQNAVTMGFANATHQELAIIYDPDVVTLTHAPQGDISDGTVTQNAPRFDGKFLYDVNVDGQPEVFNFSKPPVEMLVENKATSNKFRLIGVHTKSKAPHGAENPQDALRIMVENRRKQLAQCIWIRQRVDAILAAKTPLVVLGDFNDGPGVNGYETLFARSGVEIVLGDKSDAASYLIEPHAQIVLNPRQAWALSTARFYIGKYKRYMNALLDYIMLSPDLYHAHDASWRIWHPFDDPVCFKDAEMQLALLNASDHFPVSVDLHF
ncbi:MAG: endonuclease/exonuclease/phosphatase family protein [Paracoccaceae bacterium]